MLLQIESNISIEAIQDGFILVELEGFFSLDEDDPCFLSGSDLRGNLGYSASCAVIFRHFKDDTKPSHLLFHKICSTVTLYLLHVKYTANEKNFTSERAESGRSRQASSRGLFSPSLSETDGLSRMLLLVGKNRGRRGRMRRGERRACGCDGGGGGGGG